MLDLEPILKDAALHQASQGCPLCLTNRKYDMPILGYVHGAEGGIVSRATLRDKSGNATHIIRNQFVIVPFIHARDFSGLPQNWLGIVEQLAGQVFRTVYSHKELPYNIVFNTGVDAGETIIGHKHAQMRVRVGEEGRRSYRCGPAYAIELLG